MTRGTRIGGGNIPLRYRVVFVLGVVVGLLATVGFALAPYLPESVKKLIKSVLKRV